MIIGFTYRVGLSRCCPISRLFLKSTVRSFSSGGLSSFCRLGLFPCRRIWSLRCRDCPVFCGGLDGLSRLLCRFFSLFLGELHLLLRVRWDAWLGFAYICLTSHSSLPDTWSYSESRNSPSQSYHTPSTSSPTTHSTYSPIYPNHP